MVIFIQERPKLYRAMAIQECTNLCRVISTQECPKLCRVIAIQECTNLSRVTAHVRGEENVRLTKKLSFADKKILEKPLAKDRQHVGDFDRTGKGHTTVHT